MKSWIFLACGLGLFSCKERDSFWDSAPQQVSAYGLEGGIAVLDVDADRALVLGVNGTTLQRTTLPIGRAVTNVVESGDGRYLGVLAAGSGQSATDNATAPSLTLIEAPPDAAPRARQLVLSAPRTGLQFDPQGEFAVVYGSGSGQTLAENPNELLLFDLRSEQLTPLSLRSFGGRPQRFTFTPRLGLPGGARRLLIVQTEHDLALVDLEHLDRPEITVRLTSGQSAVAVRPLSVTIDDGAADRDDDTRIAVRLEGSSDILTMTLRPDPSVPMQFTPSINLTDAGGAVSDAAFVQTDAGLRLAVLVPTQRKALLIEPDTSRAVEVPLGAAFSRFSLAHNATMHATAAEAGEQALLFDERTAGVGFWAFRSAVERPYRTVEVLPLTTPISRVLPLPGAPNRRLAIAAGSVYLLDLHVRSAAQIASSAASSLHLSRRGERFWLHQADGTELAQVQIDALSTRPLQLSHPIRSVFEVQHAGSHLLFAFDAQNTAGVTVLDALQPKLEDSIHGAGLLLGDAP